MLLILSINCYLVQIGNTFFFEQLLIGKEPYYSKNIVDE